MNLGSFSMICLLKCFLCVQVDIAAVRRRSYEHNKYIYNHLKDLFKHMFKAVKACNKMLVVINENIVLQKHALP